MECVPNFSEGRRMDVIEQIANAIKSVPGVTLLDVEHDPNHNRSVMTFVGEPEAVKEAMMKAAEKAIELIDMNKHTGEHPRIGAVDVIPFIPVYGITMSECVEFAKSFAKEYAERFNIPVYLYAEAAQRDYRKTLGNIRRGEFEALKEELGVKPERDPDFGPKKIHPTAGATAIGARDFLIAFNVNLGTDNIDIAKAVAKGVREKSGGLRNVQAIGLMLADRGIAQVSMNLLNYKKTPVYRALELVKAEARRYGVPVIGTEVIGLIPLDAVIDTTKYYLQSEIFDKEQIFELRVHNIVTEKKMIDHTLVEFTDLVAAPKATPGGGSVSAVIGALGSALVTMVAGITKKRKKYAHLKEDLEKVIYQADLLRSKLLSLTLEDSVAFDEVMKAYKLPDSPEKEKAIENALKYAAEVPLNTMKTAFEALKLAKFIAEKGTPKAITDAGVAAITTFGAMEGAGLNVKINLISITDNEFVEEKKREVEQLLNEGRKLKEEIIEIVHKRMTE